MEVRNLLLDLIADALEAEVPEAKARMIRLEAKQAAVISAPEVGCIGRFTILPQFHTPVYSGHSRKQAHHSFTRPGGCLPA